MLFPKQDFGPTIFYFFFTLVNQGFSLSGLWFSFSSFVFIPKQPLSTKRPRRHLSEAIALIASGLMTQQA